MGLATDSDGRTWRRTGECNRCGECCRSGDPFNGQLGPAPVEGACPLFSLTVADGLPGCTDREHSYYLAGCNVFPQFPDQVAAYPSCSYEFELVSVALAS